MPHHYEDFCLLDDLPPTIRIVTDLNEPDGAASKTWTTRYRIPLSAATGLLAALCIWLLLFSGSAVGTWIGGIGLVVLIAWVIVFQMLFRRGY